MSTKGINILKSIRIYKCLVQPRWEYAMHLTLWVPELSAHIEEVEKAFFSQLFGAIGRNRTKLLRLLCRISAAKDRRKILALKMLERTRDRKKVILAQPRELRNFEELQWTSREFRGDVTARPIPGALRIP